MRNHRKVATLALAVAATVGAESRVWADALITKDGSGIIRVLPYPVGSAFQNTAWTTSEQNAFWTRSTEIINYMDAAVGTNYGSRYFENEKSSYPKAMFSLIWATANGNSSKATTARNYLTATASNGEDGGSIGGVQNTDRVDLYPSFTLKGQMPKYYWFGQYSGSVLGTTSSYIYKLYPSNASGDDAGWANKTYIQRMQSAFDKWTEIDPFYRPNQYYVGPGSNWTVDNRNSWVDIRGTDNLKAMREHAIYLFAHDAGNAAVRDQYADQIEQATQTIFRTGISEWDSQNYYAWGVAPWMSLYDYAPETINGQPNKTKLQAKAAVDLQIVAGALKYYHGAFSGPSKRTNSSAHVPLKGSAAQFLWPYFGDTPAGLTLSSVAPSTNDLHNTLHPILSAYRPPKAVVGLATKNWGSGHTGGVEILASKPSYGNWADPGSPSEISAPRNFETQYYGSTFQMGSVVSNSSEGDVDTFGVLVNHSTRGATSFDIGSGSGGLLTKRSKDQIGQYRNLAVWLRPNGVDGISSFEFTAPSDLVDFDRSNASAWFLRMPEDKTWIALRPINVAYGSAAAGSGSYAGENYHTATQTGGSSYFGLALEIGDLANYASFNAFRSAVLGTGGLDLSQVGSGIVTLTGSDGSVLKMAHNASNDLPTVWRNDLGLAYDWSNPDNFSLYKSVNNKPTASFSNISNGEGFEAGTTVSIGVNAADTGQAGPISLGWKEGKMRVLANGYLFTETVGIDGSVSWSERAAVASDYLGHVEKVEWYADGVKIGQDTNGANGWSLDWSGMAPGIYSIQAKAIDNDTEVGWTEAVQVVIGNEWKGSASSAWKTAANWASVVPDSTGALARFGSQGLGRQNVSVDADVSAGTLLFSAGAYDLAGPGTISIDATAGDGRIEVANAAEHSIAAPIKLEDPVDVIVAAGGELSIDGPLDNSLGKAITKVGEGLLTIGAQQEHGSGSELIIGAGTVLMETDAGAAGANLNIDVLGGVLELASTQHLASLDIGAAGSVRLQPGGNKVLVLDSLSIGSVSATGTSVPEPGAALLLVGAGAVAIRRRRAW